jgi:hypothetical protein
MDWSWLFSVFVGHWPEEFQGGIEQGIPGDAAFGRGPVAYLLQDFPSLVGVEVRADGLHILDAPDDGDLLGVGELFVNVK